MTCTAMIGVGGCGMNVLEYMAERLPECSCTIGVNRDAARMSEPSKIRHRILLDELSATDEKDDLLPAEKAEVQTVMQSHWQELKSMLHDIGTVCILAGLGGATGSWASQGIIQGLQKMGKRTVMVAVEPFGFERQRIRIAKQAQEGFTSVDYLITCSNQQLMDWLKSSTSMDEAFATMNALIGEAWKQIAQGKLEAGQYRVAASGDDLLVHTIRLR